MINEHIEQTPRSGHLFERKVRLSRLALAFEQIWPRVWLLLGVVGCFIALSLAGVWALLPEAIHKLVLGLFALAFLAVLVALVRVRMPDREAAIRRIERTSDVPHRPASSYEDKLTLGSGGEHTAFLWQAHRRRLAQLLKRLRVGWPQPRTDRRDPFAVRALLLLVVLIAVVVVGDSALDRLHSAFRFGPSAQGSSARLDAWVTPPAYTSKPPIMLADGATGLVAGSANALETHTGTIEIPDKSLLIVRSSGGGSNKLALEVPGPQTGERRRFDAGAPDNAPDVAEIRLEIRQSGPIHVLNFGREIARWTFGVIPDQPPKIAFTKEPERSPRGALKLFYKVEDTYGVVSADAHISRALPKQDHSTTAWARQPQAKKGPRPPLERPPTLTLRLPRAYPKQAEGQSFHELGDHMWAGLPARVTLVARDLAGLTGRSETIELQLPERIFRKPLARAVVEQRRKLVDDPRDRIKVLQALEALTLEPEGFIDDLQVYLGLRSAYWRLQRDGSRQARNSVIAQLWDVALRIEDGNLTDAERALRQAQERLSKALEEGASDAEIQRLMQELREALAQFLDQLTKQAQGQPPLQMPPGMNSNQLLTQRDLEQMLRNLENMARSGNRDMAQQMLSQLRDLLDRLQSGRLVDQGQSQRFGQMANELGNLIGRQQQLLDDTFRQQGQSGQGQSGRQGQQGQRGQRNQQGQSDQGDGDYGELGNRQGQLRESLGRLQQGLRDFGIDTPGQFGGAAEAMERAERMLRDGDLEGATQEESRALEQLRQGARNMAEQMLRQMPSRFGMSNGSTELDPMGRPPQRTDGPDPGVGVKVPDQIDVQRARELLEELRRRLGEQTRPMLELDYIERLLKRF
jgi:uncharacterized protein (TIGR02302 family)